MNNSKAHTSPKHIAIIMDGNGRWAQNRGKPRVSGHHEGTEVVRKIVRYAASREIRYLTLYSFSTENWSRPKDEVNALFALLKAFAAKDLQQLKDEGVCITILGRRDDLPADLLDLVQKIEAETSVNTKFFLNIAFNYGGRDEIVRAVRSIGNAVNNNNLRISEITEDQISEHLDTVRSPDPELIIRTGGENRISNFLLWQSAYAEFVVLDTLWPDFSPTHLEEAIEIYSQRERRFGGVSKNG